MTQQVLLKRSAVASKIPTTGDIALGEVAINTYDGRFYFKKDNGTATMLELVSTTVGGTIATSKLGTGTASSTTYLRGDGTWQTISAGTSVTVTDDTTTNLTYYPTFATATSGTISAIDVASTKLTFNPSTGLLTSTGFSGSGASLTNVNAVTLGSKSIGTSGNTIPLLDGGNTWSGSQLFNNVALSFNDADSLQGRILATGNVFYVQAGTSATDTVAALNIARSLTTSTNIANFNVYSDASTFNGSVTITGDLTINGTNTVINSTTLAVDDKNIELGSVTTPTDATANGGGITLRGATDKTIIWDSTNTNWTSSENWNIAASKSYKINNTAVLSATTLGSTVTASSLTSVGTITSGTWNSALGTVTAAGLTVTSSLVVNAASAGLEIGSQAASNTPYVDFHSSGNVIDYDSRILASGGTAVAGNGTLSYVAGTHNFQNASSQTALQITSPASTVNMWSLSGSATGSNIGLSATGGDTNISINITPKGTGIVSLGSAGLTTTGTITANTFSGSGASLTSLNASNLSSGTVATARLGTGTANSTTYLRGDGTWSTVSAGSSISITNDGTTNSIFYPLFVDVTTGAPTVYDVSSSKLTFTPASGKLYATIYSASGIADMTSSALVTSTTAAGQVVDTAVIGAYRVVKYIIQVVSGTAYQASEILAIHDGTTVTFNEHNQMNIGSSLGTFDMDISGGSMRLLFSPVNAVTTVKVAKIGIST